MSTESFFCTKTARTLLLKVNNANGMLLLSRNLKMQDLRSKVIPYQSPVLWKMKPKLFQNCANMNTRQEIVFKPNCV